MAASFHSDVYRTSSSRGLAAISRRNLAVDEKLNRDSARRCIVAAAGRSSLGNDVDLVASDWADTPV